MQLIQKYGQFGIYGNPQNEYRIVLRFAGVAPAGITAKAYLGNDPAERTALSPEIIYIEQRTDSVLLKVTQAKMAQVALYTDLNIELAWGGRVQFYGPYRADRISSDVANDQIIPMRTAFGETVYVYAEELLAQMLGVQEDVSAKLGDAEDIQQDIVTRQQQVTTLAGQTAADRQATNQDRQQVASDKQTVTDNLNLTNQHKNSAYNSAVAAGISEQNAKTSENNAAGSAVIAQQQAVIAQANRFAYVGSWLPNTDYIVGDGILYGNSFYRRKTAGTSGATFTKAGWDLLAAGINNRGSWSANTGYLLNDLVIFRRSAYLATSDFTSGATFNRTNWTRLAAGWSPAGAWAATTQYYEDDIVTNAGSTYRVTADHTSGASFSTANLELLAAKGNTGDNAYTTLSAGFTMPAVLSTVSVSVGTTAWMAAGMAVYVAGAGYMLVSSVTNATTAQLQNINYVGNAAAAASIASGGTVSPAGRGTPNYEIAENTSLSGSLSIDMALDPNIVMKGTLVGNVSTFTLLNPAHGRLVILTLTQGGAGNYTIALPSGFVTPFGAAIDMNLTVGGRTVLYLYALSATAGIALYVKM